MATIAVDSRIYLCRILCPRKQLVKRRFDQSFSLRRGDGHCLFSQKRSKFSETQLENRINNQKNYVVTTFYQLFRYKKKPVDIIDIIFFLDITMCMLTSCNVKIKLYVALSINMSKQNSFTIQLHSSTHPPNKFVDYKPKQYSNQLAKI